MTIVVSILGVAFAALVVWLVVRTVNQPQKWRMRTVAILVLAPLLYALSFGGACAVESRGRTDDYSIPELSAIFQPVGSVKMHGPKFAATAIDAYARLWMPARSIVGIPIGNNQMTPIHKW